MTEQIRLCLPARWDGIRSLTALRIRHYDEQGHARGRSSISGKKTTGRSEIKFFLSERPVVGHSRELASPAHPASSSVLPPTMEHGASGSIRNLTAIAAGIRNVQSGYGYPA
jgi:hypothetical protein